MAETKVVFHYPTRLLETPVVSRLVRDFNLEFNILRADVTPGAEGIVVLGLAGETKDIERALAWVKKQGVAVQPLEKDVVRIDDRCTECGACITLCPTAALWREVDTQAVRFDPDKCIACEICVPACPPRAMRVAF
ncbi:MAG: 4Fe-4S binding protein [candidate division WS1 bacterium]|nr:4Fe-4S binding protein [candidate division WS1 bacterium]